MGRHQLTTVQRGYGPEHKRMREQWKPLVEAGQVPCHAPVCLMPTRWIRPGTPWALGHLPDRSGWTGPEHSKCGFSDGGRRSSGNTIRGIPRQTRRAVNEPAWAPTRNW